MPLVPGYHGDDQDAGVPATRRPRDIGFPVLIKASAGGGGKGMRRVDSGGGLRRRARLVPARGRERLRRRPRAGREVRDCGRGTSRSRSSATRHGNCVHLFERDCSVQRRHQKVLEEAPAPGMTPSARAAMGEAAVRRGARRWATSAPARWSSSPTADGSFYFMEMNTRLQVEHPVTEMITGLDLVEWQLRVAAGEPLPLTPGRSWRIDGHAIEARIYAEDPDKGFLPSTGRLLHLAPPAESDARARRHRRRAGRRDHAALRPDDRQADRLGQRPAPGALARMRQALAQYRVVGRGQQHRVPVAPGRLPAFADADLDTGLIEREQAILFPAKARGARRSVAAGRAGRTAARGQAVARHAADRDIALAHARRLAPERPGARAHHAAPWRCACRRSRCRSRPAATSWAWTVARLFARGTAGANGQLHAQLGERRVHATVVVSAERRHVFFEGALLAAGAARHAATPAAAVRMSKAA